MPQGFKKILIIITIALLVGMLLAVGLWLYLPAYVEKQVMPKLAHRLGLPLKQLQVRQIGWARTDIGPVHLAGADAANPGIHIENLQIDYSLGGLIQKRIRGLTVSGLRLTATLDKNGFAIQGLPAMKPRSGGASFPPSLPFTLEYIALSQALVVVNAGERSLMLPLDLRIDSSRLQEGYLTVKAQAAPRNQRLELNLEIAYPMATLHIAGADIQLQRFADLVMFLPQFRLAGHVGLDGRFRFELDNLKLVDLALDLKGTEIDLRHPSLHLTEGSSPLEIRVTASDAKALAWTAGPFQVQAPVSGSVSRLTGQYSGNGQNWTLTAQAQTRLDPQPLGPRISLKQTLAQKWQLNATGRSADQLRFSLESQSVAPPSVAQGLKVHIGNATAVTTQANLRLQGKRKGQDFQGTYTVGLGDMQVTHSRGEWACPQITVGGELAEGRNPRVTFNTELKDATFAAPQFTISLPQSTLQAEIQRPSTWQMQGSLDTREAQLALPDQNLNFDGISIHLPLRWPLANNDQAGQLEVAAIRFKAHDVGNLWAKLQPQESGLHLTGHHQSRLLPDLKLSYEARITPGQIGATFELPPYTFPPEFDLGRLLPGSTGLLISGGLAAQGKFAWKDSLPEAQIQLRLTDGRLHHPGHRLDLAGIQAELDLIEPLAKRSAPRQRLQIEQLKWGQIEAKMLDVHYQIESAGQILIEGADIGWCRGRLSTHAWRIKPGKDTYRLTLFCDRLNLAQVLRQLGAAEGSGEGSVNGRIPLVWQNRQIQFDDGYLYSTPGQTGTIQLRDVDYFKAGLPPESPQYTQLDIATEALKDYTYTWAKLGLNSEQETLLLKLQLQGKPNQLLPFAYDQTLGRFKRVGGEGQADFKGIGIDVNFRSPLNQLLRYKELLAPKHR